MPDQEFKPPTGQADIDAHEAATGIAVHGLGDAATKNVGTGSGTVAAGNDSRITGAAAKASNLSDLASAATARTNLGLGAFNTLLFVHRTTDATAIQSDATVNDDSVLQLASVGVGTYEFEALIHFTTDVDADFRFTFAHTGTATGVWAVQASNVNLEFYITNQAFGAEFVSSGSAGVAWSAVAKGLLIVTATGTFKLRWAQGTSTATDTQVKAGSYLKLVKVA